MPNTIAPRGLFGVLVPWFNSVVEPELADLRPAGVSNQTARFALDATVLENVTVAAERLMPCAPAAFLIGLSTEPYPGGVDLVRQGATSLGERVGRPVLTTKRSGFCRMRMHHCWAIMFDAPNKSHKR
jgi:hypothetical protein